MWTFGIPCYINEIEWTCVSVAMFIVFVNDNTRLSYDVATVAFSYRKLVEFQELQGLSRIQEWMKRENNVSFMVKWDMTEIAVSSNFLLKGFFFVEFLKAQV